MAYRVNAQFKDTTTSVHECVLDAPPPRPGDTVVISKQGVSVPMRVIAIWTSSSKLRGDGPVTVEVREI